MARADVSGATTTSAAAIIPAPAAAIIAASGERGSRAVAHYLGAQLAPGVSRTASAGRLDLAALVLTLAMSGAARGADGVNAARAALDVARGGDEPDGVAGAALVAAWGAAGVRSPRLSVGRRDGGRRSHAWRGAGIRLQPGHGWGDPVGGAIRPPLGGCVR